MIARSTSTPILLTNIVRELSPFNAVIWHTERQESGTLLRVLIARKNIRLLVPTPGRTQPIELLNEKSSPAYVVRDLARRRAWLQDFAAQHA